VQVFFILRDCSRNSDDSQPEITILALNQQIDEGADEVAGDSAGRSSFEASLSDRRGKIARLRQAPANTGVQHRFLVICNGQRDAADHHGRQWIRDCALLLCKAEKACLDQTEHQIDEAS
jgi:hypothetical protein